MRHAIIEGIEVEHGGTPPYTARSASDKDPDWHTWYVHGADGGNRIHFPDSLGAVLMTKSLALAVAGALNDVPD